MLEAFLSVAVVTFLGIAAGICELAHLNEQLVEARAAAQEASRLKSEFLANMSHEIRTPMTAILGYTDMLTDPGIAASDRQGWLERIRRSSEHLMELLNDILDLSKIEAGKLRVEQIACSPVTLLEEVASLMRVQAIRKGLSFAVEYEGALPEHIRTDPTRLRQVLLNLVGNAVKFTASGGIRLRVRMTDGIPPAMRFEVVDTGIGNRRRCRPSWGPPSARVTPP